MRSIIQKKKTVHLYYKKQIRTERFSNITQESFKKSLTTNKLNFLTVTIKKTVFSLASDTPIGDRYPNTVTPAGRLVSSSGRFTVTTADTRRLQKEQLNHDSSAPSTADSQFAYQR